jgi:hypothetical protein
MTKCDIAVLVCLLECIDIRAGGMGGIFSSPAEITGVLEYEPHIEGIVLYF